ncbi:hypothetical protein [Heliorestis convoluta]|uniref:Thymidylate synthase ThyX n=1 Tax=Heliorestis convoluta TaxID=356322 RepID=A0A5Q2MY85_9FIRM|nr:hypothetical protein [Heliorestis convoluta]QGG47678.1 hypothetical protein FTV88_1578 [Heliorestis convoluta]
MNKFMIDIEALTKNSNVHLNQERIDDIKNIEKFINENYVAEGYRPVQSGRVIVLRNTDKGRKSSAFASALYLGKYDDMNNTDRFLKGMVRAGHSYEPIRGETISFLYICVGKPTYDHLITYTIRNRRVAGGLRANKPWGFVIPEEAKDKQVYRRLMESQLACCEALVQGAEREKDEGKRAEQLQAVRSLYPTGVIVPPFMLDFSEEALAKHIFKQRIWEKGAQGETVEIVQDMYDALYQLDPEKWSCIKEYHGPHIVSHNRAMQKLREQRPKLGQLLKQIKNDQTDVYDLDVYELLMTTVGRLPKTMWE